MDGLQTLAPKQFAEVFKANFDAKLLDAIVEGYAENAVLDLGGDDVFIGRDQIRVALAAFLAPALPISVTPRRTLVTGDDAVVLFDWSIEGQAIDGSSVSMRGAAVDVLRREADGVWRQILDLPFGHATASA